MRILSVVLIVVVLSNQGNSQYPALSQSQWSDSLVSVSCVSVDTLYNKTDTACFAIEVKNKSGKPIFVSGEFDRPRIRIAYPPHEDFLCYVDLAFEWWWGSDPLLTGVGPAVQAVVDSASTMVKVPLGQFKRTSWNNKVFVEVWFCYIADLTDFDYLLSQDTETRRQIGNKECAEFGRRQVYARINPVLLEMR